MNVRIASTLALMLGLALAPVAGAQTQQTGDQAPPDDLDQTLIEVKSEAARKLLGRDTIPVRRRVTHYMPSGEVPIPRLAPVSVEDVGAALAQAIARHSGEQGGKVRQRRQGPFLVAEAGSHRYWASLASGAYKLTDIEASMAKETRLGGFDDALQTALDYVAKQGVVALGKDEMLDIVVVSAVRNVLAEVGQDEPKESFLSDYYVVFGRRVQGIPVIGERLLVRLDGEGKVAALERHWPPLKGVGEQPAKITDRPLEALIAESPQIESYSDEPLKPEEITIVDRRCGYLAAPISARQTELRPGCIVSFRIRDQLDEGYPQMIVPLEEGMTAERLWETNPAQ
jgi:hypothetical protein